MSIKYFSNGGLNIPEGLRQLQRLVYYALLLLIVPDFRVTLIGVDSDQAKIRLEGAHTVRGKSLRRGWPSKPKYEKHKSRIYRI